MLILPAIDLLEGQCVRLTRGDYNQKTVYSDDPADVACRFVEEGATWIHVVDLAGAKAGHPVHLDVLHEIKERSQAMVEFGGGVRSLADVDAALAAGADRVILGTRLAQNAEFAQEVFGQYGDRAIAGIDTHNGKVAMHGWTEDSKLEGLGFAQDLVTMGCRRIIATDIATDGALEGPNLEHLKAMVKGVPVPVIASGGVTSLEDVRTLLPIGVEGAIVGKAIYEGRMTLRDAIAATR